MNNGTISSQQPTNFFLWRLCAWAGPIYVVAEALSWAWIARFLPPPAEYLTATEIYQFYVDNNSAVRLGMMLTLFFSPLYYIWSVSVSRLIARAEGPDGCMSTIELLGGFGTVVVTWGACTAWLSAGLHTTLKTPQEIMAINDLGWMWFNPTVMVSVTQFIAFGIAFLVDKRPQPLMPQWISWFTFAMTGTLLLALFTPFFNEGPFAWHGLFTYYVGLGGYFLWIIVVSYQLLRTIGRLERAEADR
jgi:hypothetical protein